MKWILVLAVLAALGFAVAGCGSGKKAGTETVVRVARSHAVKWVFGAHGVTVIGAGTARFTNLKPGTRVSCKGGPALTVPYDRATAAAVRGPAPDIDIKLTRSLNGTVRVSCGSSQPR